MTAVRRAPDVIVLCYHAVSDDWHAALSVSPVALRRQLQALVSRGWIGATFTEAVTAPPAHKTLAVTFDDGFRSVREHAAPILAELGLPATVFVPTDWPGRVMHWPGIDHWLQTPFERELQAMDWHELRGLQAAGWEIGAHTCSHPHLTRLDEDAIRRELVASRAVCERELAAPCRSVAYPFGDVDERVRAAAAAAGFVAGAGLSPAAFVMRDRLEWPRVGVWHGEPDWRFALKAAPLTSRLRASPTIRVVDTLRGQLKAPRG